MDFETLNRCARIAYPDDQCFLSWTCAQRCSSEKSLGILANEDQLQKQKMASDVGQ